MKFLRCRRAQIQGDGNQGSRYVGRRIGQNRDVAEYGTDGWSTDGNSLYVGSL